jgi:hypothetical protein
LGEERCIHGLRWETWRETDHLRNPGLDWRIILKWNFRKLDGGMDWIDLAQDRDRWWTLEEGVMKFQV